MASLEHLGKPQPTCRSHPSLPLRRPTLPGLGEPSGSLRKNNWRCFFWGGGSYPRSPIGWHLAQFQTVLLNRLFSPSYSAFGCAVSLGSTYQGLITSIIIKLIIHGQNFPLFFAGRWFCRRPFKPVSIFLTESSTYQPVLIIKAWMELCHLPPETPMDLGMNHRMA